MVILHPGRDDLPTALRHRAHWTRLGAAATPVMLVHPDGVPSGGTGAAGGAADAERLKPAPVVVWMHGRTVSKEIDPGRYLRWMRSGIAACAVDLPGHGERFDAALQAPEATLEVVERMVHEIDGLLAALAERPEFDLERVAIGGMSAGGMAALARLCRAHPFCAASVEATTGSWMWQRERAMFHPEIVARLNPIDHLDGWREIPLQAIHARYDEWVNVRGQEEFLHAVRRRYRKPELVELVAFERTGAPFEHAGFGRMSAPAKDEQLRFLKRWLGPERAVPR
ncbi:MAG: alpha/beta fold hydrolase [Phycisphaerales bacterium]|nr:alpha/beta fold hydrolase [Phycisphaerales bacterium]